MRFGIARVDVVQVIRRDQRHLQIFGNTKKVVVSAALDFNAVIHDLGEVIVSAENVLVNPSCG